MTWEQIRTLNQMGFEIGNHTAKHTHVNRLDQAGLVAELEYIEHTGIALGIPKPLTFAYPAYVTHPAALATLETKGYLFARVGGNRAYDPERDHPLLVPSFSTSGTNRAQILAALGQA